MAVPLSRERIVRAALDVLDETGLEGLTLRLLAGRLGVKAPALYWHVSSKAELLDEMATLMLRDLLDGQAVPPDDWREMMTAAAAGLRAMMLARRDGAKVFAGTYLTDDAAVAASEAPMRVLTTAGFALSDAVNAWQTLYCFVVGFAIEEQALRRPSGEPDPRFDATRRKARVDAQAAPLAHAASQVIFADPDLRFDFGVRTVVAGLATVLHTDT